MTEHDRNAAAPFSKIAFVNIDNFRGLLRDLRAEGYSARREGKRAIWKVYPADASTALLKICVIAEIFVDVTRTVPRGKMVMLDKPKWEIVPRVEYKYDPSDIVWSINYYGKR